MYHYTKGRAPIMFGTGFLQESSFSLLNVFITYPLGGGYVLFSLSLSLSLSSFWNNSATVREGVTKFEMPRQKLLKKCLFLFIAPFDL